MRRPPSRPGAGSAAVAEKAVPPRVEARVLETSPPGAGLSRDARERRIVKDLLADKKITDAQAKELLAQLRTVDREDHVDSKDNGGYITKRQQADMDQLLTAIRHEAKGDERTDKLAEQAGRASPPMAEVPRRDWVEQDRVRALVAQGKLTKEQGEAVIAELRAVAAEDRTDAAANGGGITKAEPGRHEQAGKRDRRADRQGRRRRPRRAREMARRACRYCQLPSAAWQLWAG